MWCLEGDRYMNVYDSEKHMDSFFFFYYYYSYCTGQVILFFKFVFIFAFTSIGNRRNIGNSLTSSYFTRNDHSATITVDILNQNTYFEIQRKF